MKALLLVLSVGLNCLVSACDTNVLGGLISEESDQSYLEKAAIEVDKGNYSGALQSLDKISGDSNEKRILMVAAQLGNSGLDIWQIVLDVLDGGSGEKVGFDSIFDSLSDSVFGDTEERESRTSALVESIQSLLEAPNQEDRSLSNLNCFLGGILSVVAIEDANQGISNLTTSLAEVESSATGTGSTAAECPGIGDLNRNLDLVSSAQSKLALILQTVEDCSFIDTSSNSLNSIETKLKTFTSESDKGCSDSPSCGASGACDALVLPCVRDVVNVESSADDGVVSSCELIQNCLGGACF